MVPRLRSYASDCDIPGSSHVSLGSSHVSLKLPHPFSIRKIGKIMLIPSGPAHIAFLVFFAFAMGCGPSGSKPTPPSNTAPSIVVSSSNQSEVKSAAVEGSTAPSTNAPILDAASATKERPAQSASVVANANEPITPLASAREIPPVTLKPAALKPTAEQLARWAQAEQDRKSTRLNSSHPRLSRMPSSA